MPQNQEGKKNTSDSALSGGKPASLASFDGSDKNHDEVDSITPCVVSMRVYAACNVASQAHPSHRLRGHLECDQMVESGGSHT